MLYKINFDTEVILRIYYKSDIMLENKCTGFDETCNRRRSNFKKLLPELKLYIHFPLISILSSIPCTLTF
jgi:hypothetical protein